MKAIAILDSRTGVHTLDSVPNIADAPKVNGSRAFLRQVRYVCERFVNTLPRDGREADVAAEKLTQLARVDPGDPGETRLRAIQLS